ncbi:MAG: hypothetical protein K0R65_1982 [Crocinitomicaceae bacterium]|jgi:hypothetical protein|nr:hypothetical protein [Crocinitomicaceae bacterium]
MKKTTYISGIICLGGLLIAACSQQQLQDTAEKSAIRPPLKGIDVKGDLYRINPGEKTSITTREGTTITIPANILVDENGKKIKGKVELSYRSINTPGEIIASGIPMGYDSAGVNYDFISAGMFEIRAKAKGKEVFIEKGKSIGVDFASYKEGDDFSFYKIDEKSGKWSYKGITKPKTNEVKLKKLDRFRDENMVVFDIDYSTHEELRPFHNLQWICLDPAEKDNPITNEWVAKERWFEMGLNVLDKEKGIYEVYLSNGVKEARFKVSPYQMDNESIAGMNDKIASMNETVRLKKEEEQRIQFEADITRNFEISSFGTYNWDKIEKEVAAGNLVVTNASFNIDSKEVAEDMNVYHFSGKDKLLSRVTKKWDKLLFNPNETNKILVVLPDNYVAVSDPNEFTKAKNSPEFMFKLKKRGKKIKSISELDELLAQK